MNFKKEYEKAFADISAGDDFKKQLAGVMNQRKSVRSFPVRTVGIVASAAALALVVGAVYLTNVDSKSGGAANQEHLVAQESSGANGNQDGNLQTEFQAGANDTLPGQSFTPTASWCANVESDAEKYELFVELLGSAEVEALYASDEQGFGEEDLLEAGKQAELAEMLSGAVAAQNATESNVKYYKAVLAEDRTIVFQIWNEEFVRIAGVSTVYRIE